MAWSDAARAAALEARRMKMVHARAHRWEPDGYWQGKHAAHVKAAASFTARYLTSGDKRWLNQAKANTTTANNIAAKHQLKARKK